MSEVKQVIPVVDDFLYEHRQMFGVSYKAYVNACESTSVESEKFIYKVMPVSEDEYNAVPLEQAQFAQSLYL